MWAWRKGLLVAAVALAAAACSDVPDGGDAGPATVLTTRPPASVTLPSTTTTAAPASTSTTAPAPTTTVAYQGLPATVPVPVAGVLTLTGGDTYSDGFLVTGPPAEEVLAWLVAALPEAGWTVVEQTAEPGDRRRFQGTVEFEGRGALGEAAISQRPDGVSVEMHFTARH